MKKIAVIICLVIALSIVLSPVASAFETVYNTGGYVGIINNPPEDSKEELYRDIFITLLYPHINKAIGDYYRKYLKYLPGEDPWSIKILSIERTKGYEFVIKLEVMPYVGPHNSVGLDHITVRVSLWGVKVEKFEHIKSYSIPPNYQDIIKKWPPQ